MATGSSDTPIALRDPIANLNSILDLYSGKTTTSTTGPSSQTTGPETSTTTTKSNLTPEQLQSAIDQAMAPLNAAAHAAGLSTYSDTSLALGRGQVAGDILAQHAGTTSTTTNTGRTVTDSGKTTVQQTPGALSPTQIGNTTKSLLLTQLGAPLLSKLGKSNTFKSLGDAISGGLDSILSPTTTASGVAAGMTGADADIMSNLGDIPLVAASGATAPLADAVSDAGTNVLGDALTTLAGDAGTSVLSDVGTNLAGDVATNAVSGATSDAAASAVADAGSSAGSSIWDDITSWFKEGGLVDKNKILAARNAGKSQAAGKTIGKKNGYADGGYADAAQDIGSDSTDGYATGGYIDRPAAPSNLQRQSEQNPILSATGEVDQKVNLVQPAKINPISTTPSVADTARINLVNSTAPRDYGGNGTGSVGVGTGTVGGLNADGSVSLGRVGPGPMLSDIGPGNVALSALATMGPVGLLSSKLISAITDTPNVTQLAINTAKSIPGEADPTAGQPTNAMDALMSLTNAFGTGVGDTSVSDAVAAGMNSNAGYGDAGDGGDSGSGDGAGSSSSGSGTNNSGGGFGGGNGGGDGGGEASGGPISGPGTSTSDSIPTHLSDGEYVIDAKTVQALGPEFFQKIQAMFNPDAIASQRAKGRI